MNLQEEAYINYLKHCYDVPNELPKLPLDDEPYVAMWQKTEGKYVLDCLKEAFGLPIFNYQWENKDDLSISFTETLGGRLPVITTKSHKDFLFMDALLNGREQSREVPATVNAFTMKTKAETILGHRIIILNFAPYSNVASDKLGLSPDEWLIRSQKIRLAHESAHYETLRLFGGMKNHPLDEIVADGFGQIAAFGNFCAERQRLFFGLEKGKDTCNGRLSFYVANIPEKERGKIYNAVNVVLDNVETEIQTRLSRQENKIEVLTALAGKSIFDRLGNNDLR
ncbi:hypothetical protein [Anaerovibrio lipolyticus]|uniref:DUF7005 family protein n=1 Tax=Anaerovibrio lipolyticus TaxID=82374 RepID=UPI0023F3C5EA|nr:hypothetical protein [Anaerovibrio lipolyticus]